MPTEVKLDLTDVRKLLKMTLSEVERLDGSTVTVDYDRGRTRINSAEAAAISRDLLRLADYAQAAGAELSTQYWRHKGFQDPRDIE